MPMYDYKCLDCGKESLVVLTLKEHESSKVKCPKCGSTKMQQLYTSFVAHTTKKSWQHAENDALLTRPTPARRDALSSSVVLSPVQRTPEAVSQLGSFLVGAPCGLAGMSF